MKNDWTEKVTTLLQNPRLVDQMTKEELKGCCRTLMTTALALGQRSVDAEADLNRQTAWALTMVGADQGKWSYLHRDEVLRLAEFTGFELGKNEASWLVCGETENTLTAIYEYDEEEFPNGEAESLARRMLVHLRQSFQPRKSEIPNE